MADLEPDEPARMAADEQRLLPGEKPATREPSDAAHWVYVYTELRQTKRQLIANLKGMMEGQSPDAKAELERADVQLLEVQVARFERRLAFWQSRLAELDGHSPASRPDSARRP